MPIATLEGLVAANLAEKKTSRAQFAQNVGIKSSRTLKHKIRGESQLNFSEAVALSDLLGITLDDLWNLMHPSNQN